MTRDEAIAYLEGLDSVALGELIDELQRRLGLPPASSRPEPITMGAMPTMGMPDPYAVILLGFHEARKIDVIRLVRELRPIGVLEAKRLVESAPVSLGDFDSRHDAERLAERVRDAGGRAEVR